MRDKSRVTETRASNEQVIFIKNLPQTVYFSDIASMVQRQQKKTITTTYSKRIKLF